MKRAITTAAMTLAFCTAAHAQWAQTGGPIGESIYSVATDGDVTVAVGVNPGMLRYDGTAWNRIDSIDAYNVFAVGKVLFASPLIGEMVRSDDGGVTWTTTDFNAMLTGITGTEKDLFTALGPEVYHSTDTGRTWKVAGMIQNGDIDRVLFANGRLLARTYDRTLLVSADTGRTWSATGQGFPSAYLYSWDAAGDTIFASIVDSGAYVSRDGGATWNAINEGLPVMGGVPSSGIIKRVNGKIWLGTARGIFQLQPAGWAQISTQPVYIISTSETESGTDEVYIGSNAGIFRIGLSGMNWTMLNDTFRNQEIVEMVRSAGSILAATPGGIYRTTDNGASWTRAHLYETRSIAMTGAAGVALVDQQGGRVYRTVDDGRTWIEGVDGLTEPVYGATSLASAGSTLYMGFGSGSSIGAPGEWMYGGVFRSTDGGAHWTLASNGLPVQDGEYASVLKLAAWGDDVVAITSEGLYHSGDKGGTWTRRNVTLVGHSWNNHVQASMDTFYVATGNKVYRSVGGESWTAEDLVLGQDDSFMGLSVVNGVPIVVVSRPSEVPRFPVYARGKDGWKALEGMPEDVRFATFMAAGNDILGGTGSSSVWRAPLSVLGGGASGVDRPGDAVRIVSSSPNPFRDETVIRFSTASSGKVRLSVADPLGREVAEVFSGDLAAGAHQFRMDGRGLAPGAYFYRIETGGAISVGKVVKSE